MKNHHLYSIFSIFFISIFLFYPSNNPAKADSANQIRGLCVGGQNHGLPRTKPNHKLPPALTEAAGVSVEKTSNQYIVSLGLVRGLPCGSAKDCLEKKYRVHVMFKPS